MSVYLCLPHHHHHQLFISHSFVFSYSTFSWYMSTAEKPLSFLLFLTSPLLPRFGQRVGVKAFAISFTWEENILNNCSRKASSYLFKEITADQFWSPVEDEAAFIWDVFLLDPEQKRS